MRTNLENLLSEWGGWKAGHNRTGLGYPRASAFTRMRVDGGHWHQPAVGLADDDLRRVDDAIEALHPDARVVLAAHYIWPGLVKNKADRLQLSRSSYYFRIESAHQQLSHAMGGIYARGYEPILSRHVEAMSV
ncbi:hypothetical protein [Bordetella sp. LUAb4]|uniref:hypothetical protein n=1 Tax=Bordetella sp. LUAb4 TaxID=2843195 RepID=UPI001E42ED4E|nr:hypothetical protein [Bordetella sp. LUAb4]